MKEISAAFVMKRIAVAFVLILALCAGAWGQDTFIWKDPTGVTPGEVDVTMIVGADGTYYYVFKNVSYRTVQEIDLPVGSTGKLPSGTLLTVPNGFTIDIGDGYVDAEAYVAQDVCVYLLGGRCVFLQAYFLTGGIPPGSQGVFSFQAPGTSPQLVQATSSHAGGGAAFLTNGAYCYVFGWEINYTNLACEFLDNAGLDPVKPVEGEFPWPQDCSTTACPMTEALGTIASTAGTVTVTDATGNSAPAVVGQSITLLDTLTTGANGSAVVGTPDGSTLSLSSMSAFQLIGNVSVTKFIKIVGGRLWAKVMPNPDRCSNDSEVLEPCDAFDISAGHSSGGVRGTDVVIETDGTTTTWTVNEGTVNVADLTGDTLNSVTPVSAGSTLTIAPHSVSTPAVTATPNPLYFGASVGASSTQTITLSINTALTISSIVAGGDYSVGTNSCVTAYSAAATCTVPITFAPTKPGQAWVPLVVTDSNNNSYSFGVGGTGLGAAVAFTPGIINTVAGNGTACLDSTTPCGDNSPATSGELSTPSGMAMDGAGNIYIADSGNNRIRVVNMQTSPITVAGVTIGAGNIATVAGNGAQGNTNTGNGGVKAISAELNSPGAVALDGTGNIYVADTNNSLVRKVDVNGMMTTFAGGGSVCANATDNVGDGCPATGAQLAAPTGLAVDTLGYVYIADSGNARVRKVDLNGMITTFAGNGTPGYVGDSGAATSAELQNPAGLAFDSVGNLYIADSGNNVIRKVDTSGTIATVAGNGTAGYSGDGLAATQAQLNQPRGVAVDSAGNMYIADTNNDFLRKVDAGGVITTVAGNGSNGVSCPFGTDIIGDGCPATSAFVQPWSVAVNGAGNLYLPDYGNNRIRKVDVTTTALPFASTAVGSTSGDSPRAVTVENVGNMPLDAVAPGLAFTVPSFSQVVGSGTPPDCNSSFVLAPGADCNISISFTPTVAGILSGSFVLTDNNLNVPNATQTISLNVTAVQATQTITFGAIAAQTVGTLLILSASATSGLAVTFTSASPTTCTVSGTTATFIASGGCTIEADQAGNSAYAAATQVQQSFTVYSEAQTITFGAIAAQTVGTPLTLSASATSGLAVTFTSASPTTCTVSGTTATFIASGVCSIEANQAGNSAYAAAYQVLQNFAVNGEAQTITFGAIAAQTLDTQLTLTATASSGLTVSFASTTTSICTVSGTTATLFAAGVCIIDANQIGNSAYAAAPMISQTFNVTSITVSGTAVSVAPGATTGNTSTITVTPVSGFTGTVNLSCVISPTAASDPATCSLSPASVTISDTSAQTSTLTVSTTAATSAVLVHPKRPGNPWYAAGGATLACLLLFGIPARRRRGRTMLGMLAFLIVLSGGVFACGGGGGGGGGKGGGGGGGGGNSGTTAGTYTITVTGTSSTITATNTVTLTVQ